METKSDSSQGELNPYRDWLNIDCGHQSVNYYELLGLAVFEDKEEQIRRAYEQQYEIVRNYAVGKYQDHANALLEELSDAFITLTTDNAKKSYDKGLKANLAVTTTVSDSHAARTTVADQRVTPAKTPSSAASQTERVKSASPFSEKEHPSVTSSNSIDKLTEHLRAWAADNPQRFAAALIIGGLLVMAVPLVAIIAIVLSLSGGSDVPLVAERTSEMSDAATADSPDVDLDEDLAATRESDPPGEMIWPTEVIAKAEVSWTGILDRVYVDRTLLPALRIHLRAPTPNALVPEVEAVVRDVDFLRELADYHSDEEKPDGGDLVTAHGTVAGDDPPILLLSQIQKRDGSAVAMVGDRRSDSDLKTSSETIARVHSLRMKNEYFRGTVTVENTRVDDRLHLLATVEDRHVEVLIPPTWEAEFRHLQTGQPLTLVARRAPPEMSVPGAPRRLLLEAQSIGQPVWEAVRANPSAYTRTPLKFAAQLYGSETKGTWATLSLILLDGENESLLTMTGMTHVAGVGTIEQIPSGTSVDVAFLVKGTPPSTAFELVSIAPREAPDQMVRFDLATIVTTGKASTPEQSPPSQPPWQTDAPALEMIGHLSPATAISWSPGAKVVAAVEASGATKMWFLAAGSKPQALPEELTSAALWSPLGEFVVLPTKNTYVTMCNTATGERNSATRVFGMTTWLRDGRFLSTTSRTTLSLSDPTDTAKVRSLILPTRYLYALATSPQGDRVAVCGDIDGCTIAVFAIPPPNVRSETAQTAAEICRFPCDDEASQLAWFQDDEQPRHTVAALIDDEILLTNVINGSVSEARQVIIPSSGVHCDLRQWCRHDGRMVATASAGGAILYDGDFGHVTGQLPGVVSALAFAPGKDWLAMASESSVTIHATADEIRRLAILNTPSPITRLAWSPDARFLATGHTDNHLRVWDLDRLANASSSSSKVTRYIVDFAGAWEEMLVLGKSSRWQDFHHLANLLVKTDVSEKEEMQIKRLKGTTKKQAETLLKEAIAMKKAGGEMWSVAAIAKLREASACDPSASGHGRFARGILKSLTGG